MDLTLGWQTDLAVLRLGGSLIEEHPGHLVVRTPEIPTYHWGNFLLVTDPAASDDVVGWLARFEEQFPEAGHRAIGLASNPADPATWTGRGFALEHEDVLVASAPIPAAPEPAGYDVRVLASLADWEASTELRVVAYPGQDDFERRTTAVRAAMALRGEAIWVGAFSGPTLAAELGIVLVGEGLARYQSVLTHPDHRRRGLTTHLLGVADALARDRGAKVTVIIADQDSDPGRLYRSAGFQLESTTVQAFREPPAP